MTVMGRRSALTPDVHRLIVEAVEAGNTFKDAAAYAGVPEATLKDWLGRGRGTDPERPASQPYAAFAAAIEKAQAAAIVRNVGIIQKAANETWQAAAWWLERRYPENFARRERREPVSENTSQQDNGFVAALNAAAPDVWNEEEAPAQPN